MTTRGTPDSETPPKDRAASLRADDPAALAIALSSPDNVMLLDTDGTIRFINWTVPDLTPKQVLGTKVFGYVPEEHRGSMRSCFERVLRSKQPDRYETVYVAEGGELSYWESRVGPVVRDGEVVGFSIISSNITERSAAAADRDQFFNLSIDMLCVGGFDGYFKRLNPAFGRVLGCPPEELLSRPFLDFVHPDDQEATRRAMVPLGEGRDLLDFENRFRCKSGAYRWFSWRATADRDRRLIFAVARDVTEHRRTEAQVLQTQKMEAIGQLAGGIAHDLNNLLLVVQGNLRFAQETQNAEERAQRLNQVTRAADRAAALTRQLLAFGRRQPLRPVPLDLQELLRDMTQMLRRVIPENIEIVIGQGAGSAVVVADRAQIEQVVLNLCVNARDAMPRGGNLTLKTEERQVSPEEGNALALAQGDYVLFTVSDTGTGIDSTIRDRIFEPFFTTKERDRGTGLGLSTAYGIVVQHGGALSVESEPGKGTTFFAYLPSTDRLPEPQTQPTAPAKTGGTETILLAEDEDLVRNVVVEILARSGYRVITAEDGGAALREFKKHRKDIDVVILDVIMPGMNGSDVLRRIRKIHPGIPALFTSGYSGDALTPDPELADVEMIQKPYAPETLLASVRKALDR